LVTARKYSSKDKDEWNKFVSDSRNGTFLFQRGYMDYHSDRFLDHSLLFLDDNGNLLALMPANLKNDTLQSHGGLTFGGIVSDNRMRAQTMLETFAALMDHLGSEGIRKLIYKPPPHIYHTIPSEEDLYALFRYNGRLLRREVSSATLQEMKTPFTKERRWSVRKATVNGVTVARSADFNSFMTIEEQALVTRHGVRPVHTKGEMRLLAERFPDQIKLFAAERKNEMLGGVIIYESRNVAHCQYTAATEEGRKIGAVDMVFDYLINSQYVSKRYFDFGISTEDEGRYLNIGLSDFKSSYGARAVVYDTYEIAISENMQTPAQNQNSQTKDS
jgi:hypothetical protein